MIARLMAITGPIGLWAVCSWAQDLGSMGRGVSSDMSITDTIRTMGIMDRCLSVELNSSTIFVGTKHGMGVDMRDRLRIMPGLNMRCRGITVAAGIRADITKPLLLRDVSDG